MRACVRRLLLLLGRRRRQRQHGRVKQGANARDGESLNDNRRRACEAQSTAAIATAKSCSESPSARNRYLGGGRCSKQKQQEENAGQHCCNARA